jgi:hypothetical protein
MPTFSNEVTEAGEDALVGISHQENGVVGESKVDGAGVIGTSVGGEGVSGFSLEGNGVVGQGDVECGVRGLSRGGRGVEGVSQTGDAVMAVSDTGHGVNARSQTGHGVLARSGSATALYATSQSGRGVEGWSESSYGVSGDSNTSAGVRGTSRDGRGVEGWSGRSEGVMGICETGTGVWGVAGRSRLFGKFSPGIVGSVFDAGAAAKKYAEAAKTVLPPVPPHPEPPVEAPVLSQQPLAPPPLMTQTLTHSHLSSHLDLGLEGPGSHLGEMVAIPFDDTAGVGVCGEHRGGGIGVRALSRSGMGLSAYSDEYEAIHAETRSLEVAAIAAYNSNPRGRGAALYAKKVGPLGHAGFFDGRVWIGGELGVGGDIQLANADCAEDFDISGEALAEPGSVMVIGEDGALHACQSAYDRRVAGVISGAGSYKPALVLDRQARAGNRSPIALMGKVCCKVSTEAGPIEIGDLLTTAATPGHAMKVSDPARGFGAVIGKALQPLREGCGLITILVGLQ